MLGNTICQEQVRLPAVPLLLHGCAGWILRGLVRPLMVTLRYTGKKTRQLSLGAGRLG